MEIEGGTKKKKVTFKVKQSAWGSHSKEGGRHANEDRHVAITKENMWLLLEKHRLKANKVKEKESRKEAKKKGSGFALLVAPSTTPAEPKQATASDTTATGNSNSNNNNNPPATRPRTLLPPGKKRSQVWEGAPFSETEVAKVASQIQFGACFFAVYDGHGGKKTVNYVKKHLHKNIINQDTRQLFFVNSEKDIDELGIVKAIYRGFKNTEQQLMQKLPRRDESGTCAVVIIQLHSLLFVANLGDSRAVVARQRAQAATTESPPATFSSSLPSFSTGSLGTSPPSLSSSPPLGEYEGKFKALALTKDHKAIDPKEMKRIYANGGWVSFNRVFGIIAVSRSFGDMLVKGQQPSQQQTADKPTSALGKTAGGALSPLKRRRNITGGADKDKPKKQEAPRSPAKPKRERKPRSKSTDNNRAFANTISSSPKKNGVSPSKQRKGLSKDAEFTFMADEDLDLISNINDSAVEEQQGGYEPQQADAEESGDAGEKGSTIRGMKRRDDGDETDSIRPDDEIDSVDLRSPAIDGRNFVAPSPSPRKGRSHRRSNSLSLVPPHDTETPSAPSSGQPKKAFKAPRESHSDSEAEEVPDKGWVKFIKDSTAKAKKASGKTSKDWLWDQAAKAPPGVVIAVPVVKIFRRKPQDKFLLLASDGLWDVMTNAQAIEFVAARLKMKQERNKKLTRGDLSDICKHLCKRAKQLGSLDDITALLVLLE